ncbi:MAG: presqualene diphosphate synthase HpnD [Variibacter sp.]
MAVSDNQTTEVAQVASGSSFYAAMRILPRAQREGMFEIYRFCRRVDDIADSDLPRDERVRRLAAWRRDIDAIFAGEAPAGLEGLARVTKQFGLRREDFLAVIDGMEMDAHEDILAPDFATLDLYCDRVASAVGRLSVRVFGMPEEPGRELAYHLGRALQLTNILRDIDEDAEIGRLYLPREALQGAGITSIDPVAVTKEPDLGKACAMVVERAFAHFDKAYTILRTSERRAVRAPRIMAEVYRRILDGMVARGFAPPRERVRVGKATLLAILIRYAII